MSQELTMTNGKAEMAFVGETPWHGLGQQLNAGASIEDWAAAAGMDWKIQRSKVRYFADRDGASQLEWPDHNVLFRSDSKLPLGLVSKKFKVVQPREILEFFRDLTSSNGFELETAGTLFGGRRFWALAKIGEEACVLNAKDKVGGFLLLRTGADGTLATSASLTTVRVVCNNTLSMAMKNEREKVSVTHRSQFDPMQFKDMLGIAQDSFGEFMVEMRKLAKQQVTYPSAVGLTLKLLRPASVPIDAPAPVIQEVNERISNSKNFESIMQRFDGQGRGALLEGVKGTAWGWVNAVTEHVDFGARTASDSARLDSAWFGRGDALKTRAVEIAHELIA